MSITEAIYFEKSIITIPITPEQYVLSEKLQKQNVTYLLKYQELAYDHLLYAIQHLLEDESVLKHRNKLLKKQLLRNLDNMDVKQKTLNAIEMTLATDGLDYLKPHSYHLNFWSSILIDVMLILIMGLIAILAIPFLLTCCILKRSYQNQTNLELLSNNKQTHRYHCKVNEFLMTSTTASLRTCVNLKHHRQNSGPENDQSSPLTSEERRRSSNSDIHERRKRLSSNSSSCCNCSSSPSSSSAPTTPLSKRETSPLLAEIDINHAKDI